jgi:hypothetical protein
MRRRFTASLIILLPLAVAPSSTPAQSPAINWTFRKVHKPLKRKGQRNKGAEGQREGTYIALCPLEPVILCPWFASAAS